MWKRGDNNIFGCVVCAGADCEMVMKKDVLKKHLHELLRVCHKYEVTHVFPTLYAVVKSVLTIENCCDYYRCTADCCPNDECTASIFNYIMMFFGQVIHTNGFMRLAHTHPGLVVQLVRCM